jgi:hypothetical protein
MIRIFNVRLFSSIDGLYWLGKRSPNVAAIAPNAFPRIRRPRAQIAEEDSYQGRIHIAIFHRAGANHGKSAAPGAARED